MSRFNQEPDSPLLLHLLTCNDICVIVERNVLFIEEFSQLIVFLSHIGHGSSASECDTVELSWVCHIHQLHTSFLKKNPKDLLY